jgi:hypothetical protein
MKTVSRSFGLARLLVAFSLVASAAQVTGVLMDKMCSATAAKEGQTFAASHDTKCALEASCQKTGYGVFTADNKFILLDATGNKQAVAALKATKKADHLNVTVEGDIQGDTIKVASLKLQ